MEAKDIKQLAVSATTTYSTKNGDLSYSITKKVEENNLISVIANVSKTVTAEDGKTKVEQQQGIWQYTNGRRIYSPEECCTDETLITDDFKSILSVMQS